MWLDRTPRPAVPASARLLSADSIPDPARWLQGLIFQDHSIEGLAAWQLACRTGGHPLVIANADAANYWWKTLTAAHPPCATRTLVGQHGPEQQFIFAVDSAELMHALWSHSSEDDRFAIACIAPNPDPEGVLAAWCERPAWRTHGLSTLAETCGWVYTQIYGGGSDEHSAVFVSRDPAEVLWVRDFVDSQSGREQVGLVSAW